MLFFCRALCTIGMNILYFLPSWVTKAHNVFIACFFSSGGNGLSLEELNRRTKGWIILEAKSDKSNVLVNTSTVFNANL